MQNFTSSFIPEVSGHDWPLQSQTQLCSVTLWGVTWQQRLKHSGEFRFHQLNICVTLWTRRSVTPWSEICCHSYRYLPHEKSSKVNKHIQRDGENRWKQELFYIRSVFMLSLWHQEHLALASSAPRLVTSNGLLRASQGDYLCTISGSLWSLCDNSILS